MLIITTSLKEKNSASRNITELIHKQLLDVGFNCQLINLVDYKIPFFDGRFGSAYVSKDLDSIIEKIEAADSILFSFGSYWGSISGVTKNLFDVICGATYMDHQNIFVDKKIGVINIGADDFSVTKGNVHIEDIFMSLKANLVSPPMGIRVKDSLTPDKLIPLPEIFELIKKVIGE